MRKWWTGLALWAGCVGLAPLQAQQPNVAPSPWGAARIPEPIPCYQAPNIVPGPINPAIAPPGPGPDSPLSLPDTHTSAFQCDNFPPEERPYFHIGALALQRQRLGDFPLAVVDPRQRRIDTGIDPPPNARLVMDMSQISEIMQPGVMATFGWLFDDSKAIEVSGWYIFENTRSLAIKNPGALDSFFQGVPLGFEGDNGMWLQADRMTFTKTSRIFNGEVNYRYTNKAVFECDFLFGVRYMDLQETLAFFTDDDGIIFPMANGQPDPKREALYQVRTKNRMVLPQIGMEFDAPFLPNNCFPWITWAFQGKVGVGPNFLEVNTLLQRGDGLVGFTSGRNEVIPSGVAELGLFVDLHPLERFKIRAGYTTMWLLDIANVQDVFDYNLHDKAGRVNNNGSLFFHGPSVEFRFLF
jgi:hypothetical protein